MANNYISDNKVKTFFNKYYTQPVSFASSDIDTVVGYFEKRKFDRIAAQSVAGVLLTQAKKDGVNVQQLIDTLQGTDDIQLSYIVSQILNLNRQKNTLLGFKVNSQADLLDSRNIVY